MFKILNGFENIDSNNFLKLKKVKYLDGTTSSWLRNNVDSKLESVHFPRGPSMFGISCQKSVIVIVIFILQQREIYTNIISK